MEHQDPFEGTGGGLSQPLHPEYVPQAHTHVLLTPGFFSPPEADQFPTPILHHTGRHVWIQATYADDFPENVVQVVDGRDDGYSQDGNRVVSVPLCYVQRYMTDVQAENYTALRHWQVSR